MAKLAAGRKSRCNRSVQTERLPRHWLGWASWGVEGLIHRQQANFHRQTGRRKARLTGRPGSRVALGSGKHTTFQSQSAMLAELYHASVQHAARDNANLQLRNQTHAARSLFAFGRLARSLLCLLARTNAAAVIGVRWCCARWCWCLPLAMGDGRAAGVCCADYRHQQPGAPAPIPMPAQAQLPPNSLPGAAKSLASCISPCPASQIHQRALLLNIYSSLKNPPAHFRLAHLFVALHSAHTPLAYVTPVHNCRCADATSVCFSGPRSSPTTSEAPRSIHGHWHLDLCRDC
jgi:hypothetical protein